ncbi:carcinoembryonic antigen-related cell adhesion molecule 1-like [Ostrea edulis]|uniref:carcinoembryonic antigen-related cell adhesion molecule 1-like n=1 Tax=Ostrea edulis TaxID=37623 RepID=UPI0024AF1FD7|nr:carcinoembryonic antigen-related cell adhesion molecule 1-like [Ostrea edulis]
MKNLTWTADFFPRSGQYHIYHFYGDKDKTVIQVRDDSATSIDPVKYTYHTRPYNSINIVFEVKNITLKDAGYYGGGTSQIAARSGSGVVLVVKGKPTKPEIRGTMNSTENSDFSLTCTSQSTSRPSYYSKTVSLNYIWYRNNTVIDSETKMTLRFPRISRDVRFNKYSCQSKESIVSEESEEIQINVLYGPNSVAITPQLPVHKTVSVKNGDYIGPYNCQADCNPPCTIQWNYKLSNGTFREAKSNGSTLLQQRVFRDQVLFRCVARSTYDKLLHTPIILYIRCKNFIVNTFMKHI